MKLLPNLPKLPSLQSLPALPISPRLGAVLVLLLLLMGLGTALTSRQSHAQQQTLDWLAQTALPSTRLLHELSGHVDELRGLQALHLMLGGADEAPALERQIHQRRQAIQQRLAAFGRGLVDATEHAHFEAAAASLAVFVAEQDKLLAISRQGALDAASAATARSLLTGPSQLAYQRLSADLAAWSAYVEQRTDQASRQARAAAAGLPWHLALQAALMLAGAAVLGAALWAGVRQHAAGQPAGAAPRPAEPWADWPRRRRLVDLAGNVERLAFEAHLLALNAAVAAARQGQPGLPPSAGREEGVRHLARRVADATGELRRLLAGDAPPDGPSRRAIEPAAARSGVALAAGQGAAPGDCR